MIEAFFISIISPFQNLTILVSYLNSIFYEAKAPIEFLENHIGAVSKGKKSVIPATAGIHKHLFLMDACTTGDWKKSPWDTSFGSIRRHDKKTLNWDFWYNPSIIESN